MFNAFDSWVLAKMQKFCDIFQVVTGITKYAVTKWGMILRTFGFVSLVTIYAVPGANTLLKTLFVLFALSVVTDCLITIKRLELEEKHFLKTGQMLGWTEHNFNRPWFRLFHFPFMIQSVFTLGSGSGIAYFCTVLARLRHATP